MIWCCKGCEKRYPGCHYICPDYQNQKAEHEKRKRKADADNNVKMGLYMQNQNAVKKALKRHSNYQKKWR